MTTLRGISDYTVGNFTTATYAFEVQINVASTTTQDYTFDVNIDIDDRPIIGVSSIIIDTLTDSMQPRFDSYYDQLRMGKTLLNLGNDDQQIVVNWERRPNNTIALKLLDPLYSEVSVGTNIFVSREVQQSVLETFRFIPLDVTVTEQLRPSTQNLEVNKTKVSGTLGEIISSIAGISHAGTSVSGSQKTFVTNQVLERYYNKSRQSAEINTDYTDYKNFVVFGSAEARTEVFFRKLQEIESLMVLAPTNEIALGLSGSVAESGSYETVFGTLEIDSLGSVNLIPMSTALQVAGSVLEHINTSVEISNQIQELIRGFDDYEASLWFKSNIQYSASDASTYFTTADILTDYTYPKILGIPYNTTTATGQAWFTSSTAIGSSYDEDNRDRLQYNIPKFLQDDSESATFLTFLDIVGHHFDNILVYINATKDVNSRYPGVDKELSAEVSRKVLESFGVAVPSINSVESLARYVTGDNTGSVVYKDVADEYYKRYLHALPHLLKVKGTGKSIDVLMNVFGINPNVLTVRESLNNQITSVQANKIHTTEQDFSLNFNSGSYVVVPFSSSLREPKTIQTRFATIDRIDQTVLNFDDSYRLDAIAHPSASSNAYYLNFGRLDLISSSTVILSSSYFELFDEQFVSTQLSYDAGGVNLYIRKLEEGDYTFSQSLQETAMSMSGDWDNLTELYIGSPPISSSAGYISSSLDEFRMWGEVIDEDKFIDFAENPGIYAGQTYTSSLYSLYGRLSFNLPTDVETNGFVTNTTPYLSVDTTPDLSTFVAVGFNSGDSPMYQTSRCIRDVLETTYNVGANRNTTDMIVISPPVSTGSGVQTLSMTNPLVNIGKKFRSGSVGSSRLDISISPMDAIDRDIIRSYGNINLGDYVGNPIDRFASTYSSLDTVHDTFISNLAPIVDYNSFIRFFDKFLHLFYEVVDDYIPARSRTTKGIVIRSDILNRNKITTRTNIRVSGENTLRTLNAITSADKDVIRSADGDLEVTSPISSEIQADYTTVDASLQLPNYSTDDIINRERIRVDEWSEDYETTVDVSRTRVPINSDREDYTTLLRIIDLSTSIRSDVVSGYNQTGFDDYSLRVSRTKEFGVTSAFPGYNSSSLYSIGPASDFYDKESYTYFNKGDGLYYVDGITESSVTQSYMPTTPSVTTWSAGTSYTLGDVVLQSGLSDTNGNLLSQNGEYFVFTHQGYPANSSVVSVTSPQVDAQNWTRLRYVPGIFQTLIRLAYVNGEDYRVTKLTDTTLSYDSVPIEYTRKHFRFYRDNSLGGRRRTYVGTLNTLGTTIDGGQPFEVFDINVNTIQVGDPNESC
jgi:hypothetical protein